MPTYTTSAQMILTNAILAEMFPAANALDEYIDKAENQVNNDLSCRYTVPFSAPVPPMVRNLTEELATYLALHGKFTRDNKNRNDWVKDYKDNYDKWMKAIMDWDSCLLDAGGDPVDEAEDIISSNTEDYTPTFDEGSDLDMEVDCDKLDDLADEKEDCRC